jgi:ABC-type Fe3+-siderophore transport system, permease component
MSPHRIGLVLLSAGLLLGAIMGLWLGEVPLGGRQLAEALLKPGSDPGVILWQVRAPRTATAMLVGAALGLSGALMQGLLRNPLADPGVLGVSATAAATAALALVLGLANWPGAIGLAALLGAVLSGGILAFVAWRVSDAATLILVGVALSSFAGAATALIFNLSPSPIATAEVMSWLLGSVENRTWHDATWMGLALAASAMLAIPSREGLRQLTLGDEVAATSGVDMARTRWLSILATAVATGAAVAVAGVVGFVGLVAPHLVRRWAGGDPGRLLWPSALAGAVILGLADGLARAVPTDQELKVGVFTALVGAPMFAVVAWRAAREWRL